MFCGAILLPEHWTRFQLYADRVRTIGHPPREGVIHTSVWLLLATRCRGSPLIPRLRKLVASELRVSETSALFLLVSPTLRVIDISFEREDEEQDRQIAPHVATSLLQTLSLMAPDLEEFMLDSEFSLGQGYFQSFKDFGWLRSLSIPPNTPLDEHMLRTLSTVTSLQNLTCFIDLSSISTLAFPPDAFQQLTGLDVKGHFDHLVSFTLACQLPNLARIVLQITKLPRSGRPVASFSAACQCYNPTFLTSFAACFFCELFPCPDCLIEYFEPLLAFSGITSLQVYSFLTEPAIHDDDFTRFGAAWPQLATFCVVHNWEFAR